MPRSIPGPDKNLERLAGFDSATVANAIDHLAIRGATTGYASTELRCVMPDLPAVVGYAVTCLEDTTTPRGGRGHNFDDVYAAIEASPKPVVVVCQDVGLDRLRSCHLGDVMATIMQRLGATAFVTDGGIRDLAGVRRNAPGFQVFAAGSVAAAGEPSLVAVGTPVSICGLTIEPGQLLHGDGNGLLAVPGAFVQQILGETEKVAAYERDLFQFLHGPDFTLEAFFARRKK